jgi:S1-C subfamily serine protease
MTGNALEKCPKCSHEITNEVECENCGVVFEKYFQAEARRKAEAEQVKVDAAGTGIRRVAILAGLVLVSALAVALYFWMRPHVPSDTVGGNPQVHAPGNRNAGKQAFPSATVMMTESPDKKLSDAEQIQRALSATVSVRTPWGSIGSGFFIGEHEVITNKHVITFDDARLEAFKGSVERNRKIIDLESEKINEWKRRMEQMPAGPNRSQLELVIQGKEEDLSKALAMQRDNEEKLARLRDQRYSQNVKIVTADNKEYSVDSITASPTHDLALLKVYSVSGNVLQRNTKAQRLEQGQVVYTIGSPMGLNNTVTSGVFSAYRKSATSEDRYLQFDAAVNPGNSGGPLIDKQGNVLGVTTMVLAQAEGIGFAIPIDVVFEDFSGSL